MQEIAAKLLVFKLFYEFWSFADLTIEYTNVSLLFKEKRVRGSGVNVILMYQLSFRK